MPTTRDICEFLDRIFADCRPQEDFSNNGLQVEASQSCDCVAFAVDACLETIDEAAAAGAQLLVVHHGLSWGSGFRRLNGVTAARFQALFCKGVSLYACHLPLDAHPDYGNNAVIADRLGMTVTSTFANYKGLDIGCACKLEQPMLLTALVSAVRQSINPDLNVLDFSNGEISHVGIISGGGDSCLEDCIAHGVDCLVTGEFSHAHYHLAREAGVSIIAAGHYATEDTGIRELQKCVELSLDVQTVFIEAPTGL